MMRTLSVFVLLAGLQAQAQSTEVTGMSQATTSTKMEAAAEEFLEDRRNATEAGILVNSMNNGSTFANLAIIREFGDAWEIGLRGLMPLEFDRDVQIYLGQAFLRYDMVKTENVFYLEASIFQGFLSDYDTTMFSGFGGTYGYRRSFNEELSAGVNLGVDWASTRIQDDNINTRGTLVSRLGLIGSYSF